MCGPLVNWRRGDGANSGFVLYGIVPVGPELVRGDKTDCGVFQALLAWVPHVVHFLALS